MLLFCFLPVDLVLPDALELVLLLLQLIVDVVGESGVDGPASKERVVNPSNKTRFPQYIFTLISTSSILKKSKLTLEAYSISVAE